MCKVFSPKWGRVAGCRRGKETGSSSGLHLLQLRWIAKLLPWAKHSKRLTNPTNEPVILYKETGFLLGETDIR